MVRAEDVHAAIEASLELAPVVSEVRRQVDRRPVTPLDDAILVVALRARGEKCAAELPVRELRRLALLPPHPPFGVTSLIGFVGRAARAERVHDRRYAAVRVQ